MGLGLSRLPPVILSDDESHFAGNYCELGTVEFQIAPGIIDHSGAEDFF